MYKKNEHKTIVKPAYYVNNIMLTISIEKHDENNLIFSLSMSNLQTHNTNQFVSEWVD